MSPRSKSSAGFSLIEVLVGLVIGVVAILLVYQVFAVAEGYKRTTTSGGDAETSGVVSSFLITQELANAGSTLASSAQELAICPSTGDFATTWRPIPVLIHDGGGPASSDAIDVFYGVSPIKVTAEPITADTTNASMTVQSPLAFKAKDLVLVAGATDPAGVSCETVSLAGVAVNVATGVATLTPGPVATFKRGSGIVATTVVNLGPDPNTAPTPSNPVRKVRFDVCPSPVAACAAGSDGTLRSLDLLTLGATPNPMASNIVLLKAQYGLDTDGDKYVDTWHDATDDAGGNWSAASVLNAAQNQLRQIKAIRIAMIVRSGQLERVLDANGNPLPAPTTDFTTTLFPCNGAVPCTGELAGVTLPGSAGYRYRVFEQVIPLRSQIWNP